MAVPSQHTQLDQADLTDRWKAACERAGVPVINLHDERHTYSTLIRRPDPHGLGLAGARYGFVPMARYVHNQPHALTAAAKTLSVPRAMRDTTSRQP